MVRQGGSAARREWGPWGGGTRGGKWRGIDPVVPYTDAQQIASIREFYGLDRERLPLEAQLITRSQLGVAAPKRLYFLNSGAVLSLQEGRAVLLCSPAGSKNPTACPALAFNSPLFEDFQGHLWQACGKVALQMGE